MLLPYASNSDIDAPRRLRLLARATDCLSLHHALPYAMLLIR